MFLTIGLTLAGLLGVLIVGVAMIACGNAVFSHTIGVVVRDPTHRLGTAEPSATVRAAFAPYNEGTTIDPVPRLDVQYIAIPQPKGWHLVLRLLVDRDS
jgi:hypothetical protein